VALLLAVFAGIAALQHWFVRWQLERTTKQELRLWADQVAREIAYKGKWDRAGFRRASITAPAWTILTREGLIGDIEGFVPGLLGPARLPDDTIYTAPQTVVTAVGEKWRLFGRKLRDGVVIVGSCNPEDDSAVDAKLMNNAARFGSSVDSAISVRSRDLDSGVDCAVLSSQGEIESSWGGVPLTIDPHSVPAPSEHPVSRVLNGKRYLLYLHPLLDQAGQAAGTIILPKDMSLEEEALTAQDRFNIFVVGLGALLACLAVMSFVAKGYFARTRRITLEEALKSGESGTVEFKSTFQWDLRRNQFVEDRRLDVLKSIAGFLNTNGGTLFIGVTERSTPPELCGLAEDLKFLGGSRDKLQRAFRDLITTRIGPQFTHLITDRIQEAGDCLYWEVDVDKAPEPAFVRWKSSGESREQKKFYVREGPKTSDLDNESTWHYIKNRWG
jgi:hypothetical protein